MKRFVRDDPHIRPLVILAACVLGLALIDARDFLTIATAVSTFETFATIGLVALGLGLTMMIREVDLSVVGMYSMAGCIAVVMGADSAWLGLACALAAGVAAGLAQGWLIVRLRLGSVGVTLGGLLVFAGIAYVVTENRALPYENMEVALGLSAPIAGVFSIRSLVAIAIFLAATLVIGLTRYGRDIIAVGSDRRAAMTAWRQPRPPVSPTSSFPPPQPPSSAGCRLPAARDGHSESPWGCSASRCCAPASTRSARRPT